MRPARRRQEPANSGHAAVLLIFPYADMLRPETRMCGPWIRP
jgi:hypothetical protein